MKINNLISKETIIVNIEARNKKFLLEELSKVIAEKYQINATEVEDVIMERENLGSTGLGKGIAIPHGRIDSITSPIGLLVKLSSPIEFDAIDKEPVDIIFMLLAPISSGADHLNALGAVSEILRDASIVEKMRAATVVEEVSSLLGL